MLRNKLAWRAVVSNLRAYYIHNVFHDHNNTFGKGDASNSVMLIVQAVDSGVDLNDVFNIVHEEHEGIAFVNELETQEALALLREMV